MGTLKKLRPKNSSVVNDLPIRPGIGNYPLCVNVFISLPPMASFFAVKGKLALACTAYSKLLENQSSDAERIIPDAAHSHWESQKNKHLGDTDCGSNSMVSETPAAIKSTFR